MESVGSFGGWGVGVYLKRPVLESVSLIGGSGVSLTTPVMETGRSSRKGGGGMSYTPRVAICLVIGRVGILFYTPRPCVCLVNRREGSLYYTARDVFYLVLIWWGVFPTRPVQVTVSSRIGGKFLLHDPSWNMCVRSASSFRRWGVSFARPCWKLTGLSSGRESI